jgi:hypothetical protein
MYLILESRPDVYYYAIKGLWKLQLSNDYCYNRIVHHLRYYMWRNKQKEIEHDQKVNEEVVCFCGMATTVGRIKATREYNMMSNYY